MLQWIDELTWGQLSLCFLLAALVVALFTELLARWIAAGNPSEPSRLDPDALARLEAALDELPSNLARVREQTHIPSWALAGGGEVEQATADDRAGVSRQGVEAPPPVSGEAR